MVMSYLTDHLHWLEKEEGTILLRSNRNRFGNKDGQIQYTRPSFPFSRARERWKDGVWKGVNLSCFMVRTISDKHISRTFQGFFKDKLQFSRTEIYAINRHSSTPCLITLLARTRHGVVYDFYFFGQRWSHYFIVLSAKITTKWLGMTCGCIWGTE